MRQNNPKQPKYKHGFDKVVAHEYTLTEPSNIKNPSVVFVDSMSDLFHEAVPKEFIIEVFKVMNYVSRHTYQILTKRSGRLKALNDQLQWKDNIWMGVSVGVNSSIGRIKALQDCGAHHKFISIEPLLEEIGELDLENIDLVIVGGESGSEARPMQKEWVLKIKKICEDQSVPFYFKQWGKTEFNPDKMDPTLIENHNYHAKGGCMLNGKLYLENPMNPNLKVNTLALFGDEYVIVDDFQELSSIWELKSYLPNMDDTLFEQLKENIKKNGMNDPILYFELPDKNKLVIEGHSRLQAAIDLKLKDLPTKQIKENFTSLDEIKLWMIKHQFQRRNLSNVEKLQFAVLFKPEIEKQAKENLSKGGKGEAISQPIDTNKEIAKLAGVSEATTRRYLDVLQNGSQPLQRKMHKDELSIYAAYTQVKRPTKSKTRTPKVKTQEARILNNLEDGMKLLKSSDIISLVVVLDEAQIDSFYPNQKKKFGFVISKD